MTTRFSRTRAVRHFARQQQGSVILETAIMLLILLMFAFGIIDFGRVMYVSNALTNATRDGARWAAVQQNIPAVTKVQDTVRAHFNSYTFGGPALTQGNVTVNLPTVGCSTNTVSVLSSYPFNWLTPLPRLLGWTNAGSFTSTIHAKAVFKYEWCA
jgi:Flp pilus assembly protein TadG